MLFRDGETKVFELHRTKDLKGISGTGHVLDGVVFPDKTTVIRWRSKNKSTAIFKTFKDFKKIHCHRGQFELIWRSND